jgi:hypothetical protein
MRLAILLLSVFLFVILIVSLISHSRQRSQGAGMKTEQYYSLVAYRWADPAPGYRMTVEADGTKIVESWMEARLENHSDKDAFNVQAALMKVPDDVTVIDGSVMFGEVKARSAKWSEDSFRIRVASKVPNPESTVWWNIEWDDSQGEHQVVKDVPMFGSRNP